MKHEDGLIQRAADFSDGLEKLDPDGARYHSAKLVRDLGDALSATHTKLDAYKDMHYRAIKRAEKAEAELSAAHTREAALQHKACPCLHTTPCHPRCTCVHPLSSRGCRRCCSYGSKKQQRVMAEHLVESESREAALRAENERLMGELDAANQHVQAHDVAGLMKVEALREENARLRAELELNRADQ